MSLVRRVLVAYGWQLVVLAVLALAPVLWLALRVAPPADAAGVKLVGRLAGALVGFAVVGQLALASSAAVFARAIATRTPLAQRRALVAGVVQLARAIVPCLVALAAVAIGGLALALPGLALFVLFALTAASPELGAPLPAPLVDSVAAVRARLPAVALVLAVAIVMDIAIVVVAQRLLAQPLSKAPTPQELASYRTALRVAGLALVAIAPLPACALAAIRTGYQAGSSP